MKTKKRRAAVSKKKSGLFITFEGGEGVGKTTQIARLAKYFTNQGKKVVVTREPGGSVIANRIRSLLLDPKMKGLIPLAELFLYEASRAQHVVEVIKPALERGMVVICDRFTDSSVVYQGVARNQKAALVDHLNKIASVGLKPDMTFFLDLDARIGLARVGSRGVMDRLEKEALSFHQNVRKGYLSLAEKYPKRIKKIDASRGRDEIHEKIIQYVEAI
ncbi:MAG: dTMP kinase [Oligoflexia bacterium]|nr:dTMP kinase [Oligoflexia bacterium]